MSKLYNLHLYCAEVRARSPPRFALFGNIHILMALGICLKQYQKCGKRNIFRSIYLSRLSSRPPAVSFSPCMCVAPLPPFLHSNDCRANKWKRCLRNKRSVFVRSMARELSHDLLRVLSLCPLYLSLSPSLPSFFHFFFLFCFFFVICLSTHERARVCNMCVITRRALP